MIREYKILSDMQEREFRTEKNHIIISSCYAFCVETKDFVRLEVVSFPKENEEVSSSVKFAADRKRKEFLDLQSGDYLKAEISTYEWLDKKLVKVNKILEVGNFDAMFKEVK